MPTVLTLELPEGYDGNVTHLIAVSSEGRNTFGQREYGVFVAKVDCDGERAECVEEIGVDRSLGALLTDAARLVRTGSVNLPSTARKV